MKPETIDSVFHWLLDGSGAFYLCSALVVAAFVVTFYAGYDLRGPK